jgi:hypothetical protein
MVDAILSAVSGIVSYFLGSLGNSVLFPNPGLEQAFAAWKISFLFIAAGSTFVAQSTKGLIAVFIVGGLGALGLGLNYWAVDAMPPIGSATDTAWFCFQLAQSCFVGVGVRLATKLKDVLPKKGR